MFYVLRHTHIHLIHSHTHALNDAQSPQVTFGKKLTHTHLYTRTPAQS